MSYQTFVLVSDTHGSYICPSWRKAVLKFCKDVKPDRRIHCGDVWDFTCLRKGSSESERMVAIADDLEAGIKFLNDYFGQDGAKNKNDVLTWGNHDDRLFRTAAEGKGMVGEYAALIKKEIDKTTKKLKLNPTEYSVKKNPVEIGPNKYVLHGFHSGLTVARKCAATWGNSISGHVHQFQYWKEPNVHGHEAYIVGCGSTIADGVDYNKTHAAILSHQKGWYYGAINPRNGDWVLWKIIQTSNGQWLNPLKMK